MEMHKTTSNGIGIDARDFLGSYLRKEDVPMPMVVELVEVRAEEVPGVKRRKLVAVFKGLEKPLILNSTNIRRLSELFRTPNTGDWIGRVTLFVDDNVEFGGRTVGGIRIREA